MKSSNSARIVLLILFVLFGSARAADEPPMTSTGSFQALVLNEIYNVFPQRDIFRLAPQAESGPFVFYGKSSKEFVPVKCERVASFSIFSSQREGGLQVGVCPEQREQLTRLAKNGLTGSEEIRKAIFAPPSDEEKFKKAGFVYERTNLENGAELHYFPVYLVGHGIIMIPTVVLFSEANVIVIQTSVTNGCYPEAPGPEYCTNRKEGLKEIATRVQARYSPK